jgi:N-acetylmuramoyl-L-alanine amidase
MFNSREIVARTLYGEARGELAKAGKRALCAVASVIVNRWKQGFAKTLSEVCLKPYQFSCWNKNDPNYPIICEPDIVDPIFKVCLEIAEVYEMDMGDDATGIGANHYHATYIQPPYWTKNAKESVVIGSHCFYRI